MSGRKKSHPYNSWQRRIGGTRRFVQIYADLWTSEPFLDLSDKQKALYVSCTLEAHGRASDENGGDERLFYFNRALQVKVYRLYSESDTRGFNRDMSALIAHGFVDCVRSGYKSRSKNLYRLSDRWHRWGTADFEVPEYVTTNYMKRADCSNG